MSPAHWAGHSAPDWAGSAGEPLQRHLVADACYGRRAACGRCLAVCLRCVVPACRNGTHGIGVGAFGCHVPRMQNPCKHQRCVNTNSLMATLCSGSSDLVLLCINLL